MACGRHPSARTRREAAAEHERGERTETADPPNPRPPVAADAGQETPAGPPRAGGRLPWRTAGILTSLGTPIGIGVADPLFGQIAAAIELTVALTVIGTALFGSQDLSERGFRLLRWIADKPEPPGPAAPAVTSSPARPRRGRARSPGPLSPTDKGRPPGTRGPNARDWSTAPAQPPAAQPAQATSVIRADDFGK